MSTSKKYSREGRRQKISNQQASVLKTNSELSSKPPTVSSAGAVKKTRGKTARVVAQHPDTEPTPVLSVSHTATNGHLSQNTSTRPQRGRKKKTERSDFTPSERSDFTPSERSDPCADADTRRTRQQKATITPPPPPPPPRTLRSRAAKETSTHATLLCLGSPQDTTVSSPKSDSGVRTPRRGRRPKLCLSSTPQCSRTRQSQPQISPITKTLPKRVRSQNPETQQRKRTRKKAEQEVVDTPPFKRQRKKRSTKAELPQSQRIRTRFVLEDSEHQETEETTSTSDLSIELSVQEDKLSLTHTLSEEDEEDEELPSFLQQIRQ
ncbi:PWWP domain-containing DNA repair factor 3A isoform X1, partial [Tachysurus ichikawai]